MGYSKEIANKIEDNKNKYIDAGIQENITLDNVEIKESPTGMKLFQINFVNDEGQIFPHTEWEPRMGGFIDTEDKLNRAMNRQYKRMLQILLCFYKDEEIDFNGEKFSDFAKYIAEKLNNASKEIKLRVKIVFNKNGFITLPNSASEKFIEPMSIPKEESAIKIGPKDIIVRPIVADKETSDTNPFKTDDTVNTIDTPKSSTEKDDLPF